MTFGMKVVSFDVGLLPSLEIVVSLFLYLFVKIGLRIVRQVYPTMVELRPPPHCLGRFEVLIMPLLQSLRMIIALWL